MFVCSGAHWILLEILGVCSPNMPKSEKILKMPEKHKSSRASGTFKLSRDALCINCCVLLL